MTRPIFFALGNQVSDYRLVVVLLSLMLPSFNAVSVENDSRQIIQLNNAQRAHVLGEMRAMLSGTQVILASLASNDMAEVARQAQSLGTGMGHKAETTVHDVLPPAFMQLGMSVHRAFDGIAASAEAGADTKHTLRQLSSAMNACVSCHETYQIQGPDNQQSQSLQPAAAH